VVIKTPGGVNPTGYKKPTSSASWKNRLDLVYRLDLVSKTTSILSFFQ